MIKNKKVFIVIDNRKAFGGGVKLDVAEINVFNGNKKGLISFSVNNNKLITENYNKGLFVKPYEDSLFYIFQANSKCRAYENSKDALEFIKLLLNSSIEDTIKNKKASEEKLKILDAVKGDFDTFEGVLTEDKDLSEKILLEFNRDMCEI